MPKKNKSTLAAQTDKYDLYQRAVQCPEAEVELLQSMYKKVRKRTAQTLREDFSGTFAVSCEWVKASAKRQAFAVDLDSEPLAWGKKNNLSVLKPSEQKRVFIEREDVRKKAHVKCDIVAAMNFSYFIFKSRAQLLEYFKAAYKNVADNGIFACDIFGGHEVFEDNREEITEHEDFDYIWHQAEFDPISYDYLFHIHFAFKDGSRLEKAFSYEWRLWNLPEVQELLLEAGFKTVKIFWEQADKDGEGNGEYRIQKRADADPAWVAYCVALK